MHKVFTRNPRIFARKHAPDAKAASGAGRSIRTNTASVRIAVSMIDRQNEYKVFELPSTPAALLPFETPVSFLIRVQVAGFLGWDRQSERPADPYHSTLPYSMSMNSWVSSSSLSGNPFRIHSMSTPVSALVKKMGW